MYSIPNTRSGIVEKKTVLENLDLALLTIDEIIDGGYVGKDLRWHCGQPHVELCTASLETCTTPHSFITTRLVLETDPTVVASRVTMRGAEPEVSIAEQVCDLVCASLRIYCVCISGYVVAPLAYTHIHPFCTDIHSSAAEC